MNPSYHSTVEIGGMPIVLRTRDNAFRQLLASRYAGFVDSSATPRFEFDIELTKRAASAPDGDVRVEMQNGTWRLRRGDFRAQWDPDAGRGHIRQSANHSLTRPGHCPHPDSGARRRLLLHSPGLRNGRPFFFGVSGAGKLRSPARARDATLVTDEVSYVRHVDGGFAPAELPSRESWRVGENCSAPIDSLFFPSGSGKQD
jgi:hypothetical protein